MFFDTTQSRFQILPAPPVQDIMTEDFESASAEGSISAAIRALGGERYEEAAQQLWDRYFNRLCGFARTRIYDRHRRLFDESDIASSAMYALFVGIREQKLTSVDNRDEFWQMLTLVAARRAINTAIGMDRQKRGGSRVEGESACGPAGIAGLVQYLDSVAGPQSWDDLYKTCDNLFGDLRDKQHRETAVLKLAGYTNEEIATRAGVTTRTIERWLGEIRKTWLSRAE